MHDYIRYFLNNTLKREKNFIFCPTSSKENPNEYKDCNIYETQYEEDEDDYDVSAFAVVILTVLIFLIIILIIVLAILYWREMRSFEKKLE